MNQKSQVKNVFLVLGNSLQNMNCVIIISTVKRKPVRITHVCVKASGDQSILIWQGESTHRACEMSLKWFDQAKVNPGNLAKPDLGMSDLD